mmetsp:Transcript_33035/g.76141  ORF Transcript_33035/g.76141 Transcript_33035/m.76141 type:complete len:82 (-) Transcript_33035:222-467(-)
MMNKKAARLYGRMQHGIAQKQAAVDLLKKKRKLIDDTKRKDVKGQSVNKQKVIRLKDERNKLCQQYGDVGGSAKKKKKSRN